MSLTDQLSLFLRGVTGGAARPQPRTAGQPPLQIELDGMTLDVSLVRSQRKTVGIRVVEGEVRVTAPQWLQLAEVRRIVQLKSAWIGRRLLEDRQRLADRADPTQRWRDGGAVRFLGEAGIIRLSPGATASHWDPEARILHLALPSSVSTDQIRDAVQGWMQRQARQILRRRIDLLAERSGLSIRQFSLSSARTRWGSCTHDGHIRLNWRLVHFGLPVIDYVVAHELAHLRAVDHSPNFWREVGEILPGYESAKSELRRVRIEDAS